MSTIPAIPSLTFFYPSRILGGAELLYVRLARYISNNTDIPVHVIDYADGFLTRSLSNTRVHLITYADSVNPEINYDTIIVTPFSHLFRINHFQIRSKEVRLFLWCIHPTHFTGYFDTRKWFLNEQKLDIIRNCFEALTEEKAVRYMDYPNFEENKLMLKLSDNVSQADFLPICCEEYHGEIKQTKELSGEISVCWLGRIAEDKVGAIENFIQHAQKLPEAIKKRISVKIIGNGGEDERLDNFLIGCGFKYERKNTLSGTALNDFLLHHVDVGFAMGTSLLEFAKLGIPSIMVDSIAPDQVITHNRFQWLYESEGFSMGRMYRPGKEYKHTLAEMFDMITDHNTFKAIAEKCNSYYLQHHSEPAISSMLINFASQTRTYLKSSKVDTIDQIMHPWYFNVLKSAKGLLRSAR